jgi:cobalt-zinc-cadmium efflux system protein
VVVVALVGIVVNLAATGVLSQASRESLNVRGAFLHVATDLAAFVGTAIAGGIVLLTGWNRVDPIASLLVAALMFWAAWGLVREATRILMEMAPRELDPEEVGRAVISVPNVVEAHDLHVWTVTSGFPALSAHVLVDPRADCHAVRRSIELMLRERFDLQHTTLQVDHAGQHEPVSVEIGSTFRRSSPL